MVNVNAALPFNLNNSSKGLGRFRTRSPQPSVDTERSMSSASVSASHDFDEETRWPTLNVRIVRGGSTLARGRPIVRDVGSDRDGDDTEAADAQPEGVEGRSSDGAFKIQNVGSLSRSWGD
ncbi:hypothetical protein BC834DRAFT_88133 [Gloeopeniophorella convolvens]|nr:hypothetical protein BC834DRAFT_88133 [Gloeopeniophorella convolvens]